MPNIPEHTEQISCGAAAARLVAVATTVHMPRGGHDAKQFLNCKLTHSLSSVSFIAAADSCSAAQHWNKFCNCQKEAASKVTKIHAVARRRISYAPKSLRASTVSDYRAVNVVGLCSHTFNAGSAVPPSPLCKPSQTDGLTAPPRSPCCPAWPQPAHRVRAGGPGWPSPPPRPQ